VEKVGYDEEGKKISNNSHYHGSTPSPGVWSGRSISGVDQDDKGTFGLQIRCLHEVEEVAATGRFCAITVMTNSMLTYCNNQANTHMGSHPCM